MGTSLLLHSQFILPSIHVLPCHAVYFLLLTTTTYSILQCHLLLPYIARGFLWSSVMLLLAIYLIAVLCINPLDNSSFPLLLFCDKFLKSISLFFRYLYTKVFATESYALFDDRILLFLHSQLTSVYA